MIRTIKGEITMEQNLKELLLKDLCARLPYGVKIELTPVTKGKCVTLTLMILRDYFIFDNVNYLPYLRPMSSMTEEEKEEMHNLLSPEGTAIYKNEGIAIPLNHCGDWVSYEFMNRIIDYLNAHHFDYRGLIDKNLALDCTGLHIYD